MLKHLPEELTARRTADLPPESIRSAVHALEAQIIQSALARHNFSRTAAAQELGIHKTTLYRRIKKLGLSFPEKDGRQRNCCNYSTLVELHNRYHITLINSILRSNNMLYLNKLYDDDRNIYALA